MKRCGWVVLGLVVWAGAAFGQTVRVEAEEDIYRLVSPNNGSGPFWSQGCTSIARLGERVFVSQMETGEGVPLLCNTRWRLLERNAADGSWNVLTEAADFRQREPASLAVGGPSTLLLNVNDSLREPGAEYQACHPHVLKFGVGGETLSVGAVNPQWNTTPYFTDHSYRGFASDSTSGEALMLNIDAKTSKEHYALLDKHGVTRANGEITFPIRACYPYVALKDRAAHALAISDIVEPVEEWRQFKFEQTQRKWDYVFRISYYTWSPNLGETEFAEPIEIANVDATGGAISNQDLWIAPDGTAYIMYTVREVQSALMRDKFFPDKSILGSLHLVKINEGKIVEDTFLVEGSEKSQPGRAQFHETKDGRVYAVVYQSGEGGGNTLIPIYPEAQNAAPIDIPFEVPFSTFTLASVRAGNAPSNTIDIIGHRTSGLVVSYARVVIE